MHNECFQSIAEMASGISRREVSPVDLTRACLDRMERFDGVLHAFITVLAEEAMEEAREAEAAILRGDYIGPLHGIPVGLKDLIDTAGILTTAGSRLHADRIPYRDAEVVNRLRRAGAVLLGKLSMYEFATGIPMPGDYFPAARNPWDLARTPGGSSSGSAAALAARLCPAALGSDTGGSIRGPAAFSGIVGMKPTYDLVSRQGVVPLSWSLDHVGPMTRTVKDCAMVLDAIAKPESARGPGYAASIEGDVEDWRIGVPFSALEGAEGLEPDIWEAFLAALDTFKAMGADICSVELPPVVEHVPGIYAVIASSEALTYHQESLAERSQDYGQGFRHRQGAIYTGVDFVQAQRARAVLCDQMADALKGIQIFAAPTTLQTATTLEAMASGQTGPRSPVPTNIFNLTGGPSLSLPCGFDRQGLPIGLMLSASPGRDASVLRAAWAYQQDTSWHMQCPPEDWA